MLMHHFIKKTCFLLILTTCGLQLLAQEQKDTKKNISTTENQSNNITTLNFLAKYNWKLISLNGIPTQNNNAFINFNAEKETVLGYAGCNRFMGPFMVKGNKIMFPNLASTMRSCKNQDFEKDLFEILDADNLTFDIAEQTFNLYRENKLVAIFGLSKIEK